MRFGAPGPGGGGNGQPKNQSASPFRFSTVFSFSPSIPLQIIYMGHFLLSSWRWRIFILRCLRRCLRILPWMCWDQQNHTYHFAFEAICVDKCKEIFPALQETAQYCCYHWVFCAMFYPILFFFNPKVVVLLPYRILTNLVSNLITPFYCFF